MSIRTLVSASLLAAFMPLAAQAGPLTYDVNRTIGSGSVVGTITTDGTLGALAAANITGWSLTLNTSFLLSSLPSNSAVLVNGGALSADADSIDFDFGAVAGELLFQNPGIGSGMNFWCVEVTGCSGFGTPREAVQVGTGATVFAERSGVISIATISTNNVPEPTTLTLTGLALLGLAAAGARRRRG